MFNSEFTRFTVSHHNVPRGRNLRKKYERRVGEKVFEGHSPWENQVGQTDQGSSYQKSKTTQTLWGTSMLTPFVRRNLKHLPICFSWHALRPLPSLGVTVSFSSPGRAGVIRCVKPVHSHSHDGKQGKQWEHLTAFRPKGGLAWTMWPQGGLEGVFRQPLFHRQSGAVYLQQTDYSRPTAWFSKQLNEYCSKLSK